MKNIYVGALFIAAIVSVMGFVVAVDGPQSYTLTANAVGVQTNVGLVTIPAGYVIGEIPTNGPYIVITSPISVETEKGVEVVPNGTVIPCDEDPVPGDPDPCDPYAN